MTLKEKIYKCMDEIGRASSADVFSKSKRRSNVRWRMVVMLYLRYNCNLSLQEIGDMMGRDHATISYGLDKAQYELKDPYFKLMFFDFREKMKQYEKDGI